MKLYEIVIFKIAKESLEYNWLNNNENQGFEYSCFERLIEAGWTGDIERLRNASNNRSQLKNPEISGAILTLSLSILILNSQCVEGAKYMMYVRVQDYNKFVTYRLCGTVLRLLRFFLIRI